MKTVLLAGAAILALSSASFAGPAKPTLVGKSTPHFNYVLPKPAKGLKVVYSQRDNDNGVGIVSQNFESNYDVYDSQGADDFDIKKGATISEVDADGLYFGGYGPAQSVNVTFYQNKKGAPGKEVASCDSASYTDETGSGTFDIDLTSTKKCKKGVALDKGTYWVSVQANLNFAGGGGEWGWNTNNTQRGSASDWQNPGDGFGTGCTTYSPTTVCIPSGEGPDFSFALLGKGK